MEKSQRKVNSFSVNRTVYLMGLFDWELTKEEKLNNGDSVLCFSRDNETPYYQQLVEIEKEMEPKLIPMWIFIAAVSLSFITFTIYLILFLFMRDNFPTIPYFFAFCVPGMLLLFSSTVIFYYRSKQVLTFIKNESERLKDIQTRVYELKAKYGKEEKKNQN